METSWVVRLGLGLFVVFSMVLPHFGLENEFGWKGVGLSVRLGLGVVVFSMVLPHFGLETSWVGLLGSAAFTPHFPLIGMQLPLTRPKCLT